MVLDISLPGFLEDLLRYTLYSSFLFYNQYRIFYMCNQINSSSSYFVIIVVCLTAATFGHTSIINVRPPPLPPHQDKHVKFCHHTRMKTIIHGFSFFTFFISDRCNLHRDSRHCATCSLLVRTFTRRVISLMKLAFLCWAGVSRAALQCYCRAGWRAGR